MQGASLTTSDAGGGQKDGWAPQSRRIAIGDPSLRVASKIGVCCVRTPKHTIQVCRRRSSLHPSDLSYNAAQVRFC